MTDVAKIAAGDATNAMALKLASERLEKLGWRYSATSPGARRNQN